MVHSLAFPIRAPNSTGDGGPALAAGLRAPEAVAVDGDRHGYVSERAGHRGPPSRCHTAAKVLSNVAAWEQRWKGDTTDRVDFDPVNVNGSSIVVEHHGRLTGGRIVTTAANEMAQRGARHGLISICAVGGWRGQ